MPARSCCIRTAAWKAPTIRARIVERRGCKAYGRAGYLRVLGERSETRDPGSKTRKLHSLSPLGPRLSLRLRLRFGRDTQGCDAVQVMARPGHEEGYRPKSSGLSSIGVPCGVRSAACSQASR